MYSEIDDGETGSTDVTLGGLAGEAADAANGAVQTLTVIALVALILTMVLTLASIGREQRGGGVLDGLGFDSTLRTALVPAGAVMSLVALRVARQVRG